jgi:DNA polymerase III epsilon subunit-like protein
MLFFFDTETTGLPLWRDPSDDPRQPHLVQLAALLCEEDGEIVDTYSTIVDPGPGVCFEPEALKAHGITPERAAAEGCSPNEALDRFFNMCRRGRMLVGHNISFDIRIVRIAAARVYGKKWDNEAPTYCTMKRSTNICRIPHANPRHAQDWKWPRLEEAVRHFFGEGLEGAHDALVDVLACHRIYFHLNPAEKAAAA